MKNATIATSRTRATSADLIEYRPLPETWGDVAALHALRAAKAGAAERGLDPSTLEFATAPEPAQAGSSQSARARRTPFSLPRRERGTHRRRHHGNGRLAAA
ncbi:hypothetical protein [Brachybacterium sp. FME24]|uniref:hypothetical protein n=1 Tax=Brachybacterium sp. FME24 TaxID=2742605 RepID=UPI0018690E0E|nr:hypothetical protein [Brachybacterium sp. FME24]